MRHTKLFIWEIWWRWKCREYQNIPTFLQGLTVNWFKSTVTIHHYFCAFLHICVGYSTWLRHIFTCFCPTNSNIILKSCSKKDILYQTEFHSFIMFSKFQWSYSFCINDLSIFEKLRHFALISIQMKNIIMH